MDFEFTDDLAEGGLFRGRTPPSDKFGGGGDQPHLTSKRYAARAAAALLSSAALEEDEASASDSSDTAKKRGVRGKVGQGGREGGREGGGAGIVWPGPKLWKRGAWRVCGSLSELSCFGGACKPSAQSACSTASLLPPALRRLPYPAARV